MDVYDSPSLDEQIEHMQRRAALYRPNEHRVLLAAWRVVLEHFVAIGDRDAFYQVLPLCWDIFRVAARVIPSPTMDGIKLQGGQMVAMLGECMRRRDMGYGRYCAALRSGESSSARHRAGLADDENASCVSIDTACMRL